MEFSAGRVDWLDESLASEGGSAWRRARGAVRWIRN